MNRILVASDAAFIGRHVTRVLPNEGYGAHRRQNPGGCMARFAFYDSNLVSSYWNGAGAYLAEHTYALRVAQADAVFRDEAGHRRMKRVAR